MNISPEGLPIALASKEPRVKLQLYDTMVDKLILDPKGVIWRMAGKYLYFTIAEVTNRLRSLRDERRAAAANNQSDWCKCEIWFRFSFANEIGTEVGQALYDAVKLVSATNEA